MTMQSRLETLMSGKQQKITDENIKDTLLDMANYCLMELVEIEIDEVSKNEVTKP